MTSSVFSCGLVDSLFIVAPIVCFNSLPLFGCGVLGVLSTVLSTKSDIDVMFCLQSYQGLRINRSQDRINTQMIYRFALAKVECTG